MKFLYFNDTNRIVNIHPATFIHGCTGERGPIKPLEERIFFLPEGTYPWVKMWDYGEIGLSILVSPMVDESREEESIPTQENKVERDRGLWEEILDFILQKVSKPTYDTWFKETYGEMVEGSLVVNCANVFQRDWLEENYREMIMDVAKEVIGKDVELIIQSEDEE